MKSDDWHGVCVTSKFVQVRAWPYVVQVSLYRTKVNIITSAMQADTYITFNQFIKHTPPLQLYNIILTSHQPK